VDKSSLWAPWQNGPYKKTHSVINFDQLYPYNTILNNIWLNNVIFNTFSVIMVYSKHLIVVHQHPCKHFPGLLTFLTKFLNSSKMSTCWIYHQNYKLFWFASFAVVVMGKDHKSVANRQLGDTTYFKRLDRDPASDLQRLLNEKLTEMFASKEISEHNSWKSQSRPILSPLKNSQTWKPLTPNCLCKRSPNQTDLGVCWPTCLKITIVCPRYQRLSY